MTTIAPPSSLCTPWDFTIDCGAGDDDLVTRAIAWASNELWRVSGYGVCPRAEVLHWRGGCDAWDTITWGSWIAGWHVPPQPFPYDVIDLGPEVVNSVTSVRLPGASADMPAAEWLVLDWRYLARVSGDWPSGGVKVVWTSGVEPDASAIEAARALACEWMKRACGDKSCRLAKDVDTRKDGFYGIPAVDGWVASFRYDGGIFNANHVEPSYTISQQA